MCLKFSLILSHMPAPKAHTSQETIHRYVHSWNNQAQAVSDPPNQLLDTTLPVSCRTTLPDPACPPSSTRPTLPAYPARHVRRPGTQCQPTMPAIMMPADPACQACRPAQQTRPAGASPLLRPRCSWPGQPRIFQLPMWLRVWFSVHDF